MGQFPEGFLWGSACAAYQCEGGWDADGKGPSIWDDFSHTPGKVKNFENGDIACDSYHRLDEDVACMKELGVRAHRFSVSWPRVMPEGRGAVNEAGLDYYDRMVDELLRAGIEPWLTLYHWDLPSALQKKGGWLNRDTAEAFGEYAALIARRLGDRVHNFMPINEPQCITMLGYGNGKHAPGLVLPATDVVEVMHNLTRAHSIATRALRASLPAPAQIGTVTCGKLFSPAGTGETAEAAARAASFRLDGGELNDCIFSHNIFLDSLFFRRYDESAPDYVKAFAATVPSSDWDGMEKPDFIGLNIYNGLQVDEQGQVVPYPTGWPRTAINWPVTPKVLYYGPRHIYDRYGLPVYITENGLSCNDKIYRDGQVHDADRIDFLASYLTELRRASESGVPLKGYFHWSLLDNFEWAEGYNERFGLIYMDYPNVKRIPKDSARWYRNVIETNGASL